MLKWSLLIMAAAALCIALAAQPGFAQGNSQGHGKGNPHNDRTSITISFGTHDREIIREYFRDQNSNLPPGLAKRGGQLTSRPAEALGTRWYSASGTAKARPALS